MFCAFAGIFAKSCAQLMAHGHGLFAISLRRRGLVCRWHLKVLSNFMRSQPRCEAFQILSAGTFRQLLLQLSKCVLSILFTYRVTHLVAQNLPLTSKQKFRFGQSTTWCVSLYSTKDFFLSAMTWVQKCRKFPFCLCNSESRNWHWHRLLPLC